MTAPTPVAWGLQNTKTGKLGHRLYQKEGPALLGAMNHSNRWRELIAVPLFLTPTEEVTDVPRPPEP